MNFGFRAPARKPSFFQHRNLSERLASHCESCLSIAFRCQLDGRKSADLPV
jgi:hypothetical protein